MLLCGHELHDRGRKLLSHQDQDIFLLRLASFGSQNSSLILVTRIGIWQPRKCVSIQRTNSELFSSPKPPDRQGFPCSPLCKGYHGLFLYSDQAVKLKTHTQSVLRLRTRGAIPPLPQTVS